MALIDSCCIDIQLSDFVTFTCSHRDIPVNAANGVVLLLHSVRGWDDSAPDATNVFPHQSGDGQVAGLSRLGSRQIVLQGLMEADHSFGHGSPSDVSVLLKRLKRTTLYIAELTGLIRETDVRIDWQITRVTGAPHLAHFTASLIADDPLLYVSGHIDVPAGSTALPNCGDRHAYPIIELTGPIRPLTIQHPGGNFSFDMLTGPHIIDCRNGQILGPDGMQVHGRHTGAWPVVPANGGEWRIGGLSAGTIKVRRWEAWS